MDNEDRDEKRRNVSHRLSDSSEDSSEELDLDSDSDSDSDDDEDPDLLSTVEYGGNCEACKGKHKAHTCAKKRTKGVKGLAKKTPGTSAESEIGAAAGGRSGERLPTQARDSIGSAAVSSHKSLGEERRSHKGKERLSLKRRLCKGCHSKTRNYSLVCDTELAQYCLPCAHKEAKTRCSAVRPRKKYVSGRIGAGTAAAAAAALPAVEDGEDAFTQDEPEHQRPAPKPRSPPKNEERIGAAPRGGSALHGETPLVECCRSSLCPRPNRHPGHCGGRKRRALEGGGDVDLSGKCIDVFEELDDEWVPVRVVSRVSGLEHCYVVRYVGTGQEFQEDLSQVTYRLAVEGGTGQEAAAVVGAVSAGRGRPTSRLGGAVSRDSGDSEGSEEDEETDICVICHDDIVSGGEQTVETPCGHIFCIQCIGYELNQSSAKQCPVCRMSLRRFARTIPIQEELPAKYFVDC